jgi:hypothetical protein
MSYIDFKALVKKVNLKPKGVKEIVLEVSDNGLDGHLDKLSEMIDCRVDVNFESLVVNYNITLNAQTNRPIREYKVDERGVVKELEPAPTQIEADLGLPPEKVKTKEEQEQVNREVIDEFIMNGMSPNFDDLPIFDFANIVKRRLEGESYLKLAAELNISTGKIVEFVDEYRKRVAPLAIKWEEWRKGQETSNPEVVAKPKEVEQIEEIPKPQTDEESGAA